MKNIVEIDVPLEKITEYVNPTLTWSGYFTEIDSTITYILKENSKYFDKDNIDQVKKTIRIINLVDFEPRIRAILGFDEMSKFYVYPIFSKASSTLLYVYCNIVESQRVGNSFVPLLRKMTNTGESNKLSTREFTHLQYNDVTLDEFDHIHMYILTEGGTPPSFNVGTFSATLHFRPKRF